MSCPRNVLPGQTLYDSVLKQRLAAILAADVAGYSRLMSADERATVAALDQARAVFRRWIESNQGRVVDMAGDSVLAVFETAGGAVSASLAIQNELSQACVAVPEEHRMRFRIGVHLGDVMEKSDGTIYGDGVNIAARLEGLAEPGGITVSEAVQVSQRNRQPVAYDDQGEHSVKNIPHLVRAFRIRAQDAPPAPAPARPGAAPLALPDKPSIVVLPFDNMSKDPEQEFFADGVVEAITATLSRIRSFFVIARNSAFVYKGKPVDVQQVGRELGVRYVLEGADARQRRGDSLDHAVGEKFLLRITRHVVERQHRNRGFVRQRQLRARPLGRLSFDGMASHLERAHWMRDVLDRMLAQVLECHLGAIALRRLDGFRDRDAARLGQPFEPRGNVDAIAVNRAVALFHDVTEMHAHAKAHFPVLWNCAGRSREFALDQQRRAGRACRALENGEHRIPSHVDHPSLVRFNGFPEYGARPVERRYGRAFIDGHQPRIARHVGGQDGRKALPQPLFLQHALPRGCSA